MSVYVSRKAIAERAREVPFAAAQNQADTQQPADRNFGLPPIFHLATAGLYLGFIGVMALSMGNGELAIPLVICAITIFMAFGVPACWALMKPDENGPAPAWADFVRNGIETQYGRLAARDAAVQVLILPILIFAWGATVSIFWALA